MTDRINGLTVSLSRDIREDDMEYIVNAIRMIKGVQDVSLNVVDQKDYFNRTRIKYEIEDKLIKSIRDIFKEAE